MDYFKMFFRELWFYFLGSLKYVWDCFILACRDVKLFMGISDTEFEDPRLPRGS